jgi:amidohydrolase
MNNQTPIVEKALLDQIRNWRQEIHRNPEMAFEEFHTAALVAKELNNAGLAVITGIAGTGVVGVLARGKGPSIALRADMDALPIMEENQLDYVSQNNGCMHACGHDGHTAMLLGAAKVLASRDDLSGTVYFIFQPAEENKGGARIMIEDGLFERFQFDAIYGLHNMPGVPIGRFMARAGPVLASFDTFDILITGQGGHGAMPETTRDPIAAGGALIMALNTIVSRNVKPIDAAVITVGQFESGNTYNVIPSEARLKGSCRSMLPETQHLLKTRIAEVCDGIASAHDVDIQCIYEERYPPVINSQAETEFAIGVFRDLVGDENVITEFEPALGSEDFSFFLQKKPGCYFIIGNGDGCGPLHSATYNFNDDALPYGVAAWIRITEKALSADSSSR